MRNIILDISAVDKLDSLKRNKILRFLIVNEPWHVHTKYVDDDKNCYVEFALIENDALDFCSKYPEVISAVYVHVLDDPAVSKFVKAFRIGKEIVLTRVGSFSITHLLVLYKSIEILDIMRNPIEIKEIFLRLKM